MKKLLPLLIIFSFNTIFCQNTSFDQALKNAAHDSIRCRILKEEISKAADFDVKLVLNKRLQEIVDKALDPTNATKEEKRFFLLNKTKYLVNYGYIYQNAKFRDITKALKYYEKSILISKQIGDVEGIADAYTNTGFAYEDLGNLPRAIDYYQNALQMYRKLGNVNSTTIVLNNMAYVFQSQKNYTKAITYFQECLKLQNSLNKQDESLTGFLLNNIGLCYNRTEQLDKADAYYTKSFALLQKLNNEYGVGLLLNNMGENDMQQYKQMADKKTPEAQKRVIQANDFFNASLKIWEKQEDWVSKAITLRNKGMLALYQNKLDEAINYGEQSIAIAQKTGLPKAIRSGSELLYKAYKGKEDYKKAFLMLEQYHKLNDSLVNETNRKEIIEQGFAYDYDKKSVLLKAQTKAERQKTNFIYCFVIAVLFLLAFLALIWFYFYKKKQKTDKLLRETRLSLEIAEAERRRISADLHDDLGVGISTITLLSNRINKQSLIAEVQLDAQNIIKNTKKISQKLTEVIWELNAEHNNLEHLLLFIQKQGNLIFKETGIQFSMKIPLEIAAVYISSFHRKQIYLAVKECFNNAFKHAQATKVTCNVILNGQLVFKVSDDGTGFDVNAKLQSATSEGLKNLEYRLKNLKGKVELKSNARGTQILISIPLAQNEKI
jgi:signal transduction histidine kinase/Tfp pilus assembly protein PilF